MKEVDGLSLLDFVANYIYAHEKPFSYSVRWLCSSKEHQKEWLEKALSLFEEWRNEEMAMKKAREAIRRDGPYSKV